MNIISKKNNHGNVQTLIVSVLIQILTLQVNFKSFNFFCVCVSDIASIAFRGEEKVVLFLSNCVWEIARTSHFHFYKKLVSTKCFWLGRWRICIRSKQYIFER